MFGSGLCLLCMYLVFLKSNTYEKGPMEQLLHRLLFFSHSFLQHNRGTSDVLTGLEQSSSKKPIFTLGQPLPWLCLYLGLSFCFPHRPVS